jgi:MFS family permease
MAVVSILAAPLAGRLTDRVHPRILTVGGFAVLAVSLWLLHQVLAPDTSLWQLGLVFALVGLGSSFLWGPLATTANRNLPPARAGAGSGVYNATRQVGAVLGSAAIAVLIDARLAANGLSFDPSRQRGSSGGTLPDQVAGPFTDAMAQALLLLPAVLVVGLVVSLLFEQPRHLSAPASPPAAEPATESATR